LSLWRQFPWMGARVSDPASASGASCLEVHVTLLA
jgi:hypothetical protein